MHIAGACTSDAGTRRAIDFGLVFRYATAVSAHSPVGPLTVRAPAAGFRVRQCRRPVTVAEAKKPDAGLGRSRRHHFEVLSRSTAALTRSTARVVPMAAGPESAYRASPG